VKIVLERDVLAEAVAWTARALPARPAVPVLAGIRLQAGENLVLSSFDYDISAQATIPVTAEQPGSALVSGRLLAEISRSLPAKPVHITAEDGRAVVTCGSATFTLLTMPEDEYPALPEIRDRGQSVGHRGGPR
jgi:DNA polymerase-3 subunit beta